MKAAPLIKGQKGKRLRQPIPDLIPEHRVSGTGAFYYLGQWEIKSAPALKIARRIHRYPVDPMLDLIEIPASMNSAEDFYVYILCNILSIIHISDQVKRRLQDLPLKTQNDFIKCISAAGLCAFDDLHQGLFSCQHDQSCIHESKDASSLKNV
jgi:hypothetical protein